MEWKNLYRGMMMGASDIVPGVSGGTIALVLGIYDQLILSINNLMSKSWKKQLGFLIPLGVGIVGAIILLSGLIEWLFDHYPRPTQFGFLGLILGVLPFLFKKAEVKYEFVWYHYFLLVIGAVLAASLSFFQGSEEFIITEIDFLTYVFLFFSGFIASTAMVLPGISGSLILLIMGAYGTIIHAVNEWHFNILITVGIGIVIGVLTMSKIIKYFLMHYTYATYGVVIGLVIGSIYVIYPGLPVSYNDLALSVFGFSLGLLVAFILGKMEYKEVIES
ncbi:putative membrane protein [Pelagirhabdus alkalitolerans]|uniref:Putative membrane protein n=1 Tax=Pelagirhabdus alkalitolerans TaxID=1612202 RepID=A0A1G6JG70_9BACI|nr:DUF368 domain-containing protein [Pelagirhabdus alkalitolerans]SDC17710.1 putative membrane protein [Pelagirhabdus alkalitolerans]